MMRRRSDIPGHAIALALLVTGGCGPAGPMVRVERSVEATGGPAAIGLALRGGALLIEPGGEALVDAVFQFDREAMRPDVIEGFRGDVKTVQIDQPDATKARGRSRNEWALRLSPDQPLELNIAHQISGVADLRLGGLDLSRLEVEMGTGALLVDLTGAPPRRDLVVAMHLGHGQVRVRLPKGVGVRVRGRDAVGHFEVLGIPEVEDGWQNAEFTAGGPTIDLGVGVGSGEVVVEVFDAEGGD